MACCSRTNSKKTSIKEEMHHLSNLTKFGQSELAELMTRFQRMTKNSNFLTKIQFRENMGVLGLGTMLYLSDRIFDIIDDDRDGKIRFQDFALYFDKVCNGDARAKAEISFKLIDRQKQGCFSFTDFNNTMQGMINSWAAMTGQHVTRDLKMQLDARIRCIFDIIDQDQIGQVDLERYQQCMLQDPNLMEIFDFINRGMKDFNEQQQQNQDKQELYTTQMKVLEQKIENLVKFMKAEKEQPKKQQEKQQEMKFSSLKKKTSEHHFQRIPRFSGDQDQMEAIANQMDGMHSPIASLLQYDKINYQSLQLDKKAFTDIVLPSFQNQVSDVLDDSQISNVANKNQQDFSFQYINHRCQQHPQFYQVPAKVLVDNCPDTSEKNLSQISEQESEDNYYMQDQQMIIQDIQDAPEMQIKKKYIEALEYIQGLGEEVRILRQQICQDTYQKQKQEIQIQLKEHHLQALRQSSAINVHNNKQIKLKEHNKKKPKISVAFGHENFNLVINMMIGVQMAVNSINMSDDYELGAKDFKLKYYFELLPRRTQSEKSSVKVCQFFDYAPQVFNSIRTIYGIDNQSYLKSIGPESLLQSLLKGDLSTLQELTSTGKSGSFFYYTADGKFTLKTVHKHEFRFLKQILKSYYYHMKKNSDTLIIKFYGMHKIGIKYQGSIKQRTIYFVIMSNIFSTNKEIHLRYDLKGSLFKRETMDKDPTIAMKDLNFLRDDHRIKIDQTKRIQFMTQIERDCQWFSENNIIDYSLLLGIHKNKKVGDVESSVYSDNNYYDSLQIITSIDFEQTYYFGIIDILTNFSTKKKLEYLSKRIYYGPTISAVPPQDYASRFLEFMKNNLFAI